MNNLDEIADALVARRKELGWSQEKLAHRVGYSDRTVLRWEKGLCTRSDALVDWANALGYELTVKP